MPSENGTMALARRGMDTIDNLIWKMLPFHAIWYCLLFSLVLDKRQHSREGRPPRQTSASIKSTSFPLNSVDGGMNKETCPG